MRRAQAERSRTHARTRTRRKKTNTQADANEEEPKHLQHDAPKARAQAERKEGRSGNKPPRPSLNADNFCYHLSRLFAYRDFNLFATMWANNEGFFAFCFVCHQLRNRNTDNVCNLLEF
nr:MAG TPA: hypothetical protein [Caudoviricetes sp.]